MRYFRNTVSGQVFCFNNQPKGMYFLEETDEAEFIRFYKSIGENPDEYRTPIL